ncbi:TIGR03279 family radical SAM protein [Thermosynechococcus sp. JY1334]|uniref:TIGR03279 family radical SAM protein n=1 Tax=unclassified Thermosynechococcus TaxID=2622553 RepID=UPI0026713FC0|nr:MULTISPECIES: TIGR03279 family radical SAM protein [unclassified Thermosynechococcus]MDR7897871.1 TIGR03279 family radical SAM protein [Thermosynechococcus sp. JY1332]MDR7905270.1 TIGR03279 family radical SAM protein [Thermosynechococcus sp. JY1334]WKT87485.1 TIGR03279 family radical SAM protein [Thermosynechococcus sp. JY1339]WNC56424.1 TIGR03279 family radical SAM protein [Thermosynechococcus sp. JY1331]
MSDRALRPAVVAAVEPGSIAAELGFEPGDALVAINGDRPRDLIDYRFLCAEEYLTLEVLGKDGQTYVLEIEKDIDEDLGLEFTTALFDGLMQCNNRCPFCFIDQQPPGKRESLYAKDDDYRLSFLYGSYITLTNLLPSEWQRIARLRLSPLYVSVHATVASVRQRLLKNPRAGEILQQMRWFQEQRLQLHAQVVVCPGINDGECLEQTLRDLAQFYDPEWPTVLSVAVVPVGLTRFRPAEDELIPVTPDHAQAVIQRVQALQQRFEQQWQTPFAWLADEWFLIAGSPLPPAAHYQDYPQLSNGVGTIRLFLEEFELHAQQLPQRLPQPRHLSWVVGNTVEQAFAPLVARLNQIENLRLDLYALASDYWGQQMSVTGLLTGHDLIYHLKGKPLGDRLLLPSLMLKHDEPVFLDDVSLATVEEALGVPIQVVSGGAAAIIAACTHPENA